MNLWEQISYDIVRGIYVIVAKVYDIMMGLVDSTNSYDFSEFTQSIYVIAGLFMLFRVVIGMIQMIINPDQVSDKNTGAGKLISRIVVVIVLLLAFSPTGFLMGEGELLDRVEQAIIGPDGLLENFSPEANPTQNYSDVAKNAIKNNNFLVENVYAAKVKTCYFANLSYKVMNNKSRVNTNLYRVDFYNHKCDGCQKAGKYSGLYVKVVSGTEKYKGETYTFKNIRLDNSEKNNTDLELNTINNCENWYIPMQSNARYIDSFNTISGIQAKNEGKYYGGFNNLSTLVTAVEKDKEENPEVYEKNDLSKGISGINHEEAVCFATNTISSFQECTGSDDEIEECKKTKLAQFGGDYCSDEIDATTAEKDVVALMGDDKIELAFMIAIIAGVLILVFVVILCVDVVIRNLKLMLLDMLAPIPIICYADPKDKIFMNWLKMYGSVYVDLFIKLFAIKIALILIAGFDFDEIQGIEYFFVIIAILLFAKMVPSMISKIFGIELSGSMKDIGNMLKSGAGLAAGAALGGAVGAATGKGLGRISGALKGMAMGAGAGSKGNILGGAQKIGQANYLDNYAKARGMSWLQRQTAAMGGRMGLPDVYEDAQEKKAAYDNYTSKASQSNDEALSTIRKLIGNGKATGKFPDLEAAWADARVISAGGHIDRYEKIAGAADKYKQSTIDPNLYYNTETGDSITANEYKKLPKFSYKDSKTGNIIDESTYNNLTDSQKYLDNEVVEHVKGAEKAAIKDFNRAIVSGNVESVGLDRTDDAKDIAKHRALIKSADVAAKQAGYSDGHTSDNKTDAETKSAELGTIMDENAIAHKFRQQS